MKTTRRKNHGDFVSKSPNTRLERMAHQPPRETNEISDDNPVGFPVPTAPLACQFVVR